VYAALRKVSLRQDNNFKTKVFNILEVKEKNRIYLEQELEL
jgi:hypothetical protein